MKIIDGKDAVLGRLSSYIAKELLKGEEINIVNCEDIIVTGNKKTTQKEFQEKRSKIGSSQKGPKYSKLKERIVKRTIRGMLPNYREGRGRQAYKRLKCYIGFPKEFEKERIISLGKEKRSKFIRVKEIFK